MENIQDINRSRPLMIISVLLVIGAVFIGSSGVFAIISSDIIPYGAVFGIVFLAIGLLQIFSIQLIRNSRDLGWNLAMGTYFIFVCIKVIQMKFFEAKPILGLNIGISMLILLYVTRKALKNK